MARRAVHFVLDHNFPWLATSLEWPSHLRITTLAHFDRRLTRDHDDWEVLRALAQRGDVDGYVTNDADMLALPREMVALTDVRLTLVVTDSVGHDAMRATALVMLHLEQVAAQLTGKPQIFRLRPAEVGRGRTDPYEVLNVIAGRLKASPADLIHEERAEMARRAAARAGRQGGRR